jgi:hypothetical protein
MPNLTGYSETDDPTVIQVQFDDGSSQHVIDPSGSYRKEVDEVATKLGFKQAVAGLAGVAPPMPATAPITAAEAAPLQPTAADLAALGGAPPPGTPMKTMEQPLSAGAGPVTPMPLPLGTAEQHPLVPLGAPATPPGSLVTDAERQSLTANPADLAGLRRGLAEQTHGAAPVGPAQPPAQPSRAPYGAKPPMGMSGAAVTTTGLSDADRARVDATRGTAIEDTEEAHRARLEADTERVNAQWNSLTEDAKGKLAEQAALKLQEDAFTQKIAQNHQRLESDLSRKVDPGKAFAGDAGYYAFMAGFGDSLQNFGAALAGRGPVANPGETINRIINRSVQLQTEQKEQDFRKGRVTAEELTAERETIRAKQLTVGRQLTENMLAKEKNADRRAELTAAGKFIDAERSDAIAKAAEASAQHEQRQEQFSPLVSGPAAPVTNATKEALKLLGVTPEQYTKGMATSLGNEKDSPSVNDAVTSINEMDQDVATLKSLMAANGNTLPTKGVLNVPAFLRGKLAQMGVKSDMQADEANALINTYLTRKAKSYGGVITESDRESAALEFGKTGEGFLRGMNRMRTTTQRRLKQGIDTIFPGAGQQVLDLSLRRAAQTQGVPETEGIEPFEVQDVKPKDAPQSEQEQGQQRRVAGHEAYSNETEEHRAARRKIIAEREKAQADKAAADAAERAALPGRKKAREEYEENPEVQRELNRIRATQSPGGY